MIHENAIMIDVNHALAVILGYKEVEMIGRSAQDFIAPDSRAMRLWPTWRPLQTDLASTQAPITTAQPSPSRFSRVPLRRPDVRVVSVRDMTRASARL